MDYLEYEKIKNISTNRFKTNSYFSKTSQILKSGICKYFRRKIFNKYEWCVIEMSLFGLKNKGLMTNLVNRLKILIYEEISFDEIDNICLLIDILNKILTYESNDLVNRIPLFLNFCEISKNCKRNRVISYINWWWKNKYVKIDLNNITLNKINKFERNRDSRELLQLGEYLINVINNRSNKIYRVFNSLYKLEGVFGNRYRRKDAIYLFWQIVEDKFKDNTKFMKIFNFALKQFFRKGMTERIYYGIWICTYIYKYNDIDWNNKDVITINLINNYELKEYMLNRKNININEDFVVKDWHVNKKYGLAKFGLVGAKVIDENFGILNKDSCEKMRLNYISQKQTQEQSKLKSNKKKNKNKLKNNNILDDLEFIDFNNFNIVKVIDEGVCGGKPCCIIVFYNNKKYVLKEMRASSNYGRDYEFIDSLKESFDLLKLNVKRIKSNKCLDKIDKSNRNFYKNWKFIDKDCVYSIMNFYENIGDVGKHKEILEDDTIRKEMWKIRLFDGLFRSSDNILRNILVKSTKENEYELVSIDENDIYGKRDKIFGKNDWCINKRDVIRDKKIVEDILYNFDLENKIEIVKKKMKEYLFEDKIDEMIERFKNYKKIVFNELKF